jgi:hypothetical protein
MLRVIGVRQRNYLGVRDDLLLRDLMRCSVHHDGYMSKLGDPNLLHVLAIHEDFDVSKDAAARAYAQHHDEPIAIVVVKDGKVLRAYHHIKFPKLGIGTNADIPRASCYWRFAKTRTVPSEVCEVLAGQWLESDWGKPLPDLFEQVFHQQFGYALILLWPELKDDEDEHDPDENRTSKQRLAERRGRWTGATIER